MLDHLKIHFSVLDYLEVGYSYTLPRYGRIHIRAAVDDSQIVFATYGKRKQWWHYHILSLYYFQLSHDDSTLTGKKKTPSNYFK
jgi:hypothetical protein